MNETYISFYPRSGAIRIFRSTVRALKSPKFLRFRLKADGSSMIMEPYGKSDFSSFRVPKTIFQGAEGMEIYSRHFVYGVARHCGWEHNLSYRVPGRLLPAQGIVLFDLTRAAPIPIPDSDPGDKEEDAAYERSETND